MTQRSHSKAGTLLGIALGITGIILGITGYNAEHPTETNIYQIFFGLALIVFGSIVWHKT